MTRAADVLAAMLARLGPRSPQNPGKPAKRAPSTHVPDETAIARSVRVRYELEPDAKGKATYLRPFTGALNPARCGAVQTQTRSMRLDVETDADLAATLSAITDPIDYALVVFVALPSWRLDLHALMAALRDMVIERALEFERWPSLAKRGPELTEAEWVGPTPFAPGWRLLETDNSLLLRLVPAVLHELSRADACASCHSTGKVLDLAAKPPQWITCTPCEGTGRVRMGVKKRAQLLRIRYADFRQSDARFAFEWLLRECNSRITGAAWSIASARGRFEEFSED